MAAWVKLLRARWINSLRASTPVWHPGGLQGDGNGDGTLDAYEANVVSASMTNPVSTGSAFVTLVAAPEPQGGFISAFSIATLSALAPDNARFDSSIHFTAQTGTPAAVETFSLLFDGALGARGYWLQDKDGTWHNVTTAIETIDGKTRVDFVVADGGPFDLDGQVNGAVSTIGAIAGAPASIVGAIPVLPHPGSPFHFWF